MSRPVSQAQLLANRANALKSTGPRTAAGKAIVAKNAIKKLPGDRHHLPIDTVQRLRRLRDSMIESLQPADELELALVGRVVQAKYELMKIRAAERAYFDLWAAKAAEEISDRDRIALGIEQVRVYEDPRKRVRQFKPRLPKGVVLAWMLNDEKCPLHRLQLLQARYESMLHRSLRQLMKLQDRRQRQAAENFSQSKAISPVPESESKLLPNNIAVADGPQGGN